MTQVVIKVQITKPKYFENVEEIEDDYYTQIYINVEIN